MRKLFVRDGRDPFEVLFLIACICAAITGLFMPTSPMLHYVFGQYLSLWYGGLGVGGAISLAGVLRPRPLEVSSLIVERVGLWLLAGWLLAYGVTVIIEVPNLSSGIYITTAFGISSLVRAVQITRDINRIRKVAAEDEEAQRE